MQLNFNKYKLTQFKRQRLELVRILEQAGISDTRVLEAIAELPRELFINESFINKAYDNNALPIEHNQTISQPYTVAFMTELLNISKDDKILEIGTGSGYQACLLYLLDAKVYTVERIPELNQTAKSIFKEIDAKIITKVGDGSLGWKEFAPYKGILVTAAAPFVSNSLKEQLDIGGKLVIPVGDLDNQTMILIERISINEYSETKFDKFKFVPLIGKEGWSS